MKLKYLNLYMIILALFLITSITQAGNERIGINVNIGYRAPRVVINEPPVFIFSPPLGFFVAVGVPYDLFYCNNFYYLCRDHLWYGAPNYFGPWGIIDFDFLPGEIRRHHFESILRVRDDEFRRFRHEGDRFRGRFFRPTKREEFRERHEDDRREWHGERERKEGERRDEERHHSRD